MGHLSQHGDSAVRGGSLWAIAPIDDGSDAPDIAQSLLLAAPQLDNICLELQSSHDQWTWQGRLGRSTQNDGVLKVCFSIMTVEVRLARVVAVSYCADRTSCGVALCNKDGPFLTLWSSQPSVFDAWLARVVTGFTLGPNREGSMRRAAQPQLRG
jgi:hypothetical protein